LASARLKAGWLTPSSLAARDICESRAIAEKYSSCDQVRGFIDAVSPWT
jgi:hypothetical protein